MGKGGERIALDKNGIFFSLTFSTNLLIMAGKCNEIINDTGRSFCRLGS